MTGVFLGNERLRLSDGDLLGVGGEARVYRHRDLAVKLFHTPSSAKAEKLLRFPRGLPPEVIAPLELARGARNEVLGYAMRAVRGDDLLRLAQRKWREGVVSNETVCGLFANIHRVLGALHARRVVVGDLNDANVLFSGEQPFFIDADSMQFDGLPCIVGHERFLDPRLYGADLTARCAFDDGTDWYAYSVLLFGSLLYVHPFGGTQRAHPTLLRRAEARASVFRSDVLYPRAAVHYRVLPDDLLGWFERVFEKDERAEFPSRLLQLSWTRCRCGTEHARAACPDCASVGNAARREAIRYHGRCTARVVFQTHGRVLAAAMQGGIRYLYEEDGVLRREGGEQVTAQRLETGMRFAISSSATWVGHQGRLHRFVRGQIDERASAPAFDANVSTCFRTENEWLIDHASGARIGKILEGQTWLRCGNRLGFGFYRAGLVTVFFLFKQGRAGLTEVKLPALDGRVVDASCAFDDEHVCFTVATEKDGRRTVAMYLVADDGRVLASASGAPSDGRIFSSAQGRAVMRGRVVVATDEGLLALRSDSGRLVEGTLFSDSAPFVAAGCELLPDSGGCLYVVTTKEITHVAVA